MSLQNQYRDLLPILMITETGMQEKQ